MNVKRTERGWAGHFIGSSLCKFRRNTLLEYGDKAIVVSSVGLMIDRSAGGFQEIGAGRHFETMAFHAIKTDRWKDADVEKNVYFDSPCTIAEIDADDKANDMHEVVVAEIINKLLNNVEL